MPLMANGTYGKMALMGNMSLMGKCSTKHASISRLDVLYHTINLRQDWSESHVCVVNATECGVDLFFVQGWISLMAKWLSITHNYINTYCAKI